MKKFVFRSAVIMAITALGLTQSSIAQEEKLKEKVVQGYKKGEGHREVVISQKSEGKEKIVVEVDGDKVTINGKPASEWKGGNVIIRNRAEGYPIDMGFRYFSPEQNWNSDGFAELNNLAQTFSWNSNKAMLGVVSEKVDKGVKITEVNKESGAEKAGLKKDDIITKIDNSNIENPMDLTEVISSHKAGDKINITYLRNGKENKTEATLSQWKSRAGGVNVEGFPATPYNNYNGNGYTFSFPRSGSPLLTEGIPRMSLDNLQSVVVTGNRPRLGISAQDTEDGKGVKILNVTENSAAEKAGLKDNDIITEIEGTAVNSADELSKVVREAKDKNSLKMKITRDGKSENIEVKIPRKLKTTNL
jgi:serine protease Do